MDLSVASLLALLLPAAGCLEKILLNFEQNNIQPEIKKLIETVENQHLKELLMAIDEGLDKWAQKEIAKLGPQP